MRKGITFKKNERLTNKKAFEQLFNSGKSFTVQPFRLVWIEDKITGPVPVKLGISVPKRSFQKAVDRNTLKRRIREAYRKNKHLLYGVLENKGLTIALMVIYVAKDKLPYEEIEKKMVVSLQRMAEKFHS